MLKTRAGQATLEYVVLFVVLIAAFVVMSVFIQGAVQGGYKKDMWKTEGALYIPGKTAINKVSIIRQDTVSFSDDTGSNSTAFLTEQNAENTQTNIAP